MKTITIETRKGIRKEIKISDIITWTTTDGTNFHTVEWHNHLYTYSSVHDAFIY